MTTRKMTPWFLSQSGREFSFYGMVGLAVGCTAVTYSPHSFFLNKYKEFVQHYSHGKEVPLDQALQEKYQKCIEILNVSEKHKKLLNPFSVFGFDLFHAGSCTTKFGALIGIPTHFNYKTKDDIQKDLVQINLQKVDWQSKAGEKLEDALVLPDNVQMFGICREILATQNYKVYFDAAYPMICISSIYRVGQALNHRFNLYAAPKSVRVVMYTLLSTFGLGLYFFMKDYTEVLHETKVDWELCKLGPDFIESGVIFYDKLLKRNQALRELMGTEGESKYSKLGNENYLFRHPRIALIHRKEFFVSQLEETKKENNV